MNSEPVEKLASSEATNSTRRVSSSGSAMRGIATSRTAPAPTAAASNPASMGVRTLPGWMELTRMLSRASSSAAVLVIPRTPHLLATYAPTPNEPVIPAPEEILTIAPPPAWRIEGTTARMPRYDPVRLISITWRHAAGSVSAIGPKRTMPALLTSTETGPKASSAAATVAAHSASLVTSRWEKIACSPSSPASFRPSPSSTSAITTFAPSATKPRAWLAPNPRAPPVTITVRLSKRFMIDALASRVRAGVGQDSPDEVPEVELDWAPPAVARLEGQAVQRRKGRALRGLPEGVYLRSQRRVGWKCGGVDEPLDVGEREQIEPGHPLGEGIDEVDELLVGDRAVDVAVSLGELAVEVLAADEDLECPGATDKARQAVQRAPTRGGADPDLELPEDGALPAGEADVGGECKLAARTAGATSDRADRHGG